jgi:hypothetical protein
VVHAAEGTVQAAHSTQRKALVTGHRRMLWLSGRAPAHMCCALHMHAKLKVEHSPALASSRFSMRQLRNPHSNRLYSPCHGPRAHSALHLLRALQVTLARVAQLHANQAHQGARSTSSRLHMCAPPVVSGGNSGTNPAADHKLHTAQSWCPATLLGQQATLPTMDKCRAWHPTA